MTHSCTLPLTGIPTEHPSDCPPAPDGPGRPGPASAARRSVRPVQRVRRRVPAALEHYLGRLDERRVRRAERRPLQVAGVPLHPLRGPLHGRCGQRDLTEGRGGGSVPLREGGEGQYRSGRGRVSTQYHSRREGKASIALGGREG